MIREDHRARVQSFIDNGLADGGEIVLAKEDPLPEKGFFINPVVFAGLPHDNRLVQHEVFGPVGVVVPFATEEEAIRLANDTPYGLAANIYTPDVQHGRELAAQLRSGTGLGQRRRQHAARRPVRRLRPLGGGSRDRGMGHPRVPGAAARAVAAVNTADKNFVAESPDDPSTRGGTMTGTTQGAPPLAGVTVLELGTMYAAPTAGRMLRDFGARVIKVEDPNSGDFARQWTPQHEGMSIGFARLNSGKESIGIDLRRPEGRDLVRRLAATVDVVVESFRPGRLEDWGLGYDVLSAENPGLVLTRVSGFGQTGPYRERPGFGTVAETASGYAFVNGWPDSPPTSPPFGFADSIAGLSAAFGTTTALFNRTRTGRGDVVDVALYEPLMFILGDRS